MAVLAPHQVTGALGRDQHHVEILARLDLLEVDVEAVREQERCAGGEQRFDFLVQGLLGEIRHQHGYELRALDRLGRLQHLEPVLARLVPAVAAPHAHHHVEPAVAQVQRVRATLAAVAEHRDARTPQGLLVDIFLRVQTHVVNSWIGGYL